MSGFSKWPPKELTNKEKVRNYNWRHYSLFGCVHHAKANVERIGKIPSVIPSVRILVDEIEGLLIRLHRELNFRINQDGTVTDIATENHAKIMDSLVLDPDLNA